MSIIFIYLTYCFEYIKFCVTIYTLLKNIQYIQNNSKKILCFSTYCQITIDFPIFPYYNNKKSVEGFGRDC